jgi:hypothetical protein
MKVLLLKTHHQNLFFKIMIKILLCLLIMLMYLDGEHYPQCICVFPDEILDLPCSVSSHLMKDEKNILFQEQDKQQFIFLSEIQIFHIDQVLQTKPRVLIESLLIKDFEKRLFLLKHYNS